MKYLRALHTQRSLNQQIILLPDSRSHEEQSQLHRQSRRALQMLRPFALNSVTKFLQSSWKHHIACWADERHFANPTFFSSISSSTEASFQKSHLIQFKLNAYPLSIALPLQNMILGITRMCSTSPPVWDCNAVTSLNSSPKTPRTSENSLQTPCTPPRLERLSAST